jgi:predicted RND superfamily exporter protein
LRKTRRIADFVVDHAGAVAALLCLVTLFFAYPVLNAALSALGHPLPGPAVRVNTSARDLFPDHRFIHAQDKFEGFFGNASPVALTVIVENGTIFEPESLAKLKRITDALDGHGFDSHIAERNALADELEAAGIEDLDEIREELDRAYPPYPVNHDQTRSLIHRSTSMSVTEADGSTHFEPLVKEMPTTRAEAEALRDRVLTHRPDVLGQLLTLDTKAALVSVQFVTDRLSNTQIYQSIFDHVQGIVESEQDANHRIYVVGAPLVTGWVLHHAWEMVASILGAGVLIFFLLWAYFRRLHGVVIPLFAAGVTAIWGLGFTGWMEIAFDPLVLVIPMLITARAISHTVQMAERFFEDYEGLQDQFEDREDAKREAAKTAMAELIVPGSLGILTDVAGLLVILVTTIPQMRNLGIFGAFWVASIVFTVEILHPVLITLLPAPRHAAHFTPRWMNRFMIAIGSAATHPRGRWVIALGTVMIFVSATYIVLTQSVIGESRPGTSLFWPDHPVNVAVRVLGERFGGADTLVIYAEGDRRQAVEGQRVLATMERLERKLRSETGASRSFSLVDLVKAVNQRFNHGDPRFAFVPSGSFTRTWIFQARQGSPPGALRPLITDDGRSASLTLFYPDHKGDTIRRAIATADRFIEENPIGVVSIRLDGDHGRPDQPFHHPDRLEDFLYYMLGPLLPVRSHSLRVRVRNGDGFEAVDVHSVSDDLPSWLESFRDDALDAYDDAEASAVNGRIFTWPEHLEDWQPGDVDEWWDSDELGLRAVAVGEDALIVHDLRQPDGVPTYQPTQAYSRGVQFVLAGGLMGMLAAVNDEVERSHLANISLIFAVIFVLHSLTYRSILSGGIILLQIATATLLSLAYMALRGVGLNVHTLPVQAVGVGIGVDYAIYIVDRIRQECAAGLDVDESIRRAIRTTGMAVTFTATTVVGGILFWVFSSLRFQAEMAQLLIVLMVINMLGAITVVPAFYAILKPGGIGRREPQEGSPHR